MVIRVLDLVPACDTNDQGDVIRRALIGALSDVNGPVSVSFSEVSSVTSSFVNSAFVELLEAMTLDEIKARVHFVHSNRQINEMIRTRLTREGGKAPLAA